MSQILWWCRVNACALLSNKQWFTPSLERSIFIVFSQKNSGLNNKSFQFVTQMKNIKTKEKKKLNRIFTMCTTGIPGNQQKDKGENADNSIYLERGNNYFDLEFYTLFCSFQTIVLMYGNYSSCLFLKKSYYIEGGGLLSMVELMVFPDCQYIYMHHQTIRLQLSSTCSPMQ